MACFVCPANESVTVVERCGKFSRVATPGCNALNPFLCESSAGNLSLRVQQLDVRCETKTRDSVFVKMQVTVQYQVVRESIYDAFYRLTNAQTQITAYVFDVVRAIVPKSTLDDVFVTKEEIALAVKSELEKSMSAFGYQIIQTLVTDIEPDHKVKEAMNAINSAQRFRHAALEKAEGNKITKVKEAEAEAEAAYLQGQGIARQRQAIVNGLRESVVNFEGGVKVSPQEVIELMMVTQYFDLLKDVGASPGASTVFLNHNPGTVGDISSQIRNGFLQAQAGAPAASKTALQEMRR
jgi:regulator of protease activity HflC (stomatin/prohibitin superfamily)